MRSNPAIMCCVAKIWVPYLLIGAVCCDSFSQNLNSNAPLSRLASNAHILLFLDRFDPEYEYVYYYDGTNVIMQRSKFPGYSDRSFFSLASDQKARDILSNLIEMTGDIKPPLLPGGTPFFKRIYASNGTVVQEAFFTSKSDALAAARKLRAIFEKDARRIHSLPDYIQNNRVLTKDFGFSK